ncbi:MAG TPA: (2Fe-2S)-binding protein [Acidimicrobiales bacterium]|nr:(2Fe-2S)-binding protein [Acidimicrobiales bacterium]
MAERPEAEVEIVVDGHPLLAPEGCSLAAALVAGGRASWRTTRRAGEPRGLSCGIGVCFDCLVTVNGISGVRACLVEAAAGDVVVTEGAAGGA